MLTQARVQELFDYRSDGELIRKVQTSNCIKVGDVAGCLNGIGYKVTMVGGKCYYNHRLIWLWNHGYFPEHGLDHINRIRDDNRIENLREVSQSCNLRNAKQRRNTSSGVTGVTWHKAGSKWRAHIRILNKMIYLGIYDTLLEAVQARWEAEVKYGFPNCSTTSSAYLYLKENDMKLETILDLFATNDKVKVIFTKKDGSKREMTCTRKLGMIPEQFHPKGAGKEITDTLPVFDLEASGWRSFKIDSILSIEGL